MRIRFVRMYIIFGRERGLILKNDIPGRNKLNQPLCAYLASARANLIKYIIVRQPENSKLAYGG